MPFGLFILYIIYLTNYNKTERSTKLQNIRFDPSLNKINYRSFFEFDPNDFNEKKSLFITWRGKKSKRDNEYHLRGCI